MELKPNIAFFGGEPLGLPALQALVEAGLAPKLVFCNPDRPKGRGQQLQAPAIKQYALEHGIDVKQPTSFSEPAEFSYLTETPWDLFVVVAYNFILPTWLLQIPTKQTINLHPSLLPKLRGASPIRTAILHNKPEAVGISIMLLDEKMDHGPLLAQEPYTPATWPIPGTELDEVLANAGAALLAKTIPNWLSGSIEPVDQDHSKATYCKRFSKKDGELTLNPHQLPTGTTAKAILQTIYAFAGNPGAFFFYHGKRVKVTKASLSSTEELILENVIPEGKSEMTFSRYLQSITR